VLLGKSGLLGHFWTGNLLKNAQLYAWFQQGSATANIADNSLTALKGVFGNRIISCGLWPAQSPELTSCDFYLWGNLKDKVHRTNPDMEEELKENIQREILEVCQKVLLQVN
jgi:hypothetical protein